MVYMNSIIGRLIENIDNNKLFSMSILEVVTTSDKALRSVTPQTIINCFVKAGFKNIMIITFQ